MSPVCENTYAQRGNLDNGGFELLPARLLLLQRLILQLEGGAAGDPNLRPHLLRTDMDRLSLLARLRAAHARYALGSGPMERYGAGAWFRHQN